MEFCARPSDLVRFQKANKWVPKARSRERRGGQEAENAWTMLATLVFVTFVILDRSGFEQLDHCPG